MFFRLYGLDGDKRYLNAGLNLLDDVAATQDVTSPARPHYGGIKGSLPIYGRYAPLQYPNWATKFFIDALLAKQGALNASGSPSSSTIRWLTTRLGSRFLIRALCAEDHGEHDRRGINYRCSDEWLFNIHCLDMFAGQRIAV